MPRAPSSLEFLPEAQADLERIDDHNPDHAERILGKIADWDEKIGWGRVPQEHLTFLTDSPTGHNFYRERVGNSGYRVIYEISDDVMTVVAVLPKSDNTYDLSALARRASE
ncbi:RelE family protein [Natronomonas moolapensis 8.8.11]|uniref:RelE family protein n=1 Tax=Natronomonas moolapensis (strain DSM 18674 / CECT 7526 / JCM 14361 / 8.8.11) TaxID=268739 RepID=M1XN75_NATM8|nr:type II toxin-antitoxin system RelE/ParE family toxin [Natronomonas moolapensis]CCQ35358.1 RelE family protein [Natronomonas moolapensis 8.8.11]